MATFEKALAALNELRDKFAQEPWNKSFCGISMGEYPDGNRWFVNVFVHSHVPEGIYPEEHDGVEIAFRRNPRAILQAV